MSATVDVGRFSYQDEPSANPTPVCRRSGCGNPALHDGEWCAHDQAVIDAVRQEREANIELWKQHDLSMRSGRRRTRKAKTTHGRMGATQTCPPHRANGRGTDQEGSS